jgi:addiction module HigA family antidote
MSRRNSSFPSSRTFSSVPVHPGEHLREDFMQPLGLSINALALALRVPATRILAIVKEKRHISPDTALRLVRYFKTSPESWLNLQTHYELALAERESLSAITREVLPCRQLKNLVVGHFRMAHHQESKPEVTAPAWGDLGYGQHFRRVCGMERMANS